MAKMNLLSIVQKVAIALGSDEVSSIDSTPDSRDIASIAEDVYYELMAKRDWPHMTALTKANSLSNSDKPNYLSIPEEVSELRFVSYNTRTSSQTKDNFVPVEYVTPETFLIKSNKLNSSLSNVKTITDYNGVTLYVRNDKAPSYYTTFDETKLVFDSYDSSVESSLQGFKSQLLVSKAPAFEKNNNSFVPNLPSEAFPLFLSELISTASIILNREPNQKEEAKAQRQRRRMAGKSWTVTKPLETVDYGRR